MFSCSCRIFVGKSMVALTPITRLIHLKKHPKLHGFTRFPSHESTLSTRRSTRLTALNASATVGLEETFTSLKKQVARIPYITAGDPDLSTTAEALKLLDSCGSDIIELGVSYSDPLADGLAIQAAAAQSLARGTNFNAILSMLKEVAAKISCPIALFTYYNPILKCGVEKFTSDKNDEQPPSNVSPSNIHTKIERTVVKSVFDCPGMHRTFLQLAVKVFLATFAIGFRAGGFMPVNAKILLLSAQLCSFAATILCSGGYILERRKVELARMMTAGGVVAVACTLVLVVGSLLVNFK